MIRVVVTISPYLSIIHPPGVRGSMLRSPGRNSASMSSLFSGLPFDPYAAQPRGVVPYNSASSSYMSLMRSKHNNGCFGSNISHHYCHHHRHHQHHHHHDHTARSVGACSPTGSRCFSLRICSLRYVHTVS